MWMPRLKGDWRNETLDPQRLRETDGPAVEPLGRQEKNCREFWGASRGKRIDARYFIEGARDLTYSLFHKGFRSVASSIRAGDVQRRGLSSSDGTAPGVAAPTDYLTGGQL